MLGHREECSPSIIVGAAVIIGECPAEPIWPILSRLIPGAEATGRADVGSLLRRCVHVFAFCFESCTGGRRAASARTGRLRALLSSATATAGLVVAVETNIVAAAAQRAVVTRRGQAVTVGQTGLVQALLTVELGNVVTQLQHLLQRLELQLRVVLGHLAQNLTKHLRVLSCAFTLLQ